MLLPNEAARVVLMGYVASGNEPVDQFALHQLVTGNPDEAVAMEAIHAALPGRRGLRRAALQLAGRRASTNTEARRLVFCALQDPYDPIRADAARSVGQLGSFASKAIPVLEELLTDPNEDVRKNAAYSLDALADVTVWNERIRY